LDLFEFFGFFLAGGHAFSPFDNGVPHFLNWDNYPPILKAFYLSSYTAPPVYIVVPEVLSIRSASAGCIGGVRDFTSEMSTSIITTANVANQMFFLVSGETLPSLISIA
jgi:hypothetical protein